VVAAITNEVLAHLKARDAPRPRFAWGLWGRGPANGVPRGTSEVRRQVKPTSFFFIDRSHVYGFMVPGAVDFVDFFCKAFRHDFFCKALFVVVLNSHHKNAIKGKAVTEIFVDFFGGST
jgi:hypothetical protein